MRRDRRKGFDKAMLANLGGEPGILRITRVGVEG
jgi:hypothetical protein